MEVLHRIAGSEAIDHVLPPLPGCVEPGDQLGRLEHVVAAAKLL